MQSTILIRRRRADAEASSLASPPSLLLGADAMRILAGVPDISAVEVQWQQGDRVVLGFESGAMRVDFGPIDDALQANGLHRLL
jgi:hypothetical protein